MLAAQAFDQGAPLLEFAERRGMKPYAPGAAAQASAQGFEGASLAAYHLVHLCAAQGCRTGCQAVERDTCVVKLVHWRVVFAVFPCCVWLLFADRFDAFGGIKDSAYGFILAHEFGNVEHVGAFTFSHNSQAESIHHIACVIAFFGNPP